MNLFKYVVWFTAISIAVCAAFYSVYGLSHLFAGIRVAAIIAFSALELGKLVAASSLHRYMTRFPLWLKTYLTVAVLVLMLITSAGIFGFLAGGYSEIANQVAASEAQSAVMGTQGDNVNQQISNVQSRIESLTAILQQEEDRLDNLYSGNNFASAHRVEQSIQSTQNQIDELTVKLSDLQSQSIEIASNLNQSESEISNSELGPVKYLSELLGLDINTTVRIYIFMLVFVFDPLAVGLVIVANIISENNHSDQDVPPLVEPVYVNGNESSVSADITVDEPLLSDSNLISIGDDDLMSIVEAVQSNAIKSEDDHSKSGGFKPGKH